MASCSALQDLCPGLFRGQYGPALQCHATVTGWAVESPCQYPPDDIIQRKVWVPALQSHWTIRLLHPNWRLSKRLLPALGFFPSSTVYFGMRMGGLGALARLHSLQWMRHLSPKPEPSVQNDWEAQKVPEPQNSSFAFGFLATKE